jgi:hypothetical protein
MGFVDKMHKYGALSIRSLRNKIRRVKPLQLYKVMAMLILICGCEN